MKKSEGEKAVAWAIKSIYNYCKNKLGFVIDKEFLNAIIQEVYRKSYNDGYGDCWEEEEKDLR